MMNANTVHNQFMRLFVRSTAQEQPQPVTVCLPQQNSSFAVVVQRSAVGPVSIIKVMSTLDQRNYAELIDKAQELRDGGVERIVVDISEVESLGLCCLYALHAIARLVNGKSYPGSELGMRALRRLCEANLADGLQEKVLLVTSMTRQPEELCPGEINRVFPLYSSAEEALAAFSS